MKLTNTRRNKKIKVQKKINRPLESIDASRQVLVGAITRQMRLACSQSCDTAFRSSWSSMTSVPGGRRRVSIRARDMERQLFHIKFSLPLLRIDFLDQQSYQLLDYQNIHKQKHQSLQYLHSS